MPIEAVDNGREEAMKRGDDGAEQMDPQLLRIDMKMAVNRLSIIE